MSTEHDNNLPPSVEEGEQSISVDHMENGDVGVRQKRKRSETKVKYGGAFPECVKIIRQLMNHKFAGPFLEPVDPILLNVPDYHDVITNPMDLGTIEDKLTHGEYEDADEFANDVNLVWFNCEAYNGKDHDFTVMTKSLKKLFDKLFSKLKTKAFEEVDDIEKINTVGSTPRKISKSTNSVVPQTQKSNEPTMTFEEKRQLCIHINNLEQKYLSKVIQIMHKSIPNLLDGKETGEEEVEISIESLSAQTLRELDQYIKQIKGIVP